MRRRPAALLALLLAGLLLAALAPVARADDPRALRDAVERALAAAERAERASGAAREAALAEARTAVEAVRPVDVPGGAPVTPETASLREKLAPGADPADAAAALRGLRATLAALAQPEPVNAERADRTIKAIVARPEYQTAGPSVLDRALDWLLEKVVIPVLRWMFNTRGGSAPSPALLLGLAGTLAVVAVAAWYFRGAFSPKARREIAATAAGATRSIGEQRLAEAAAAAGNYRQALHHLYLALLYELDDTGRLRFDPSLTNRELVAESGAEPALVELVARYDATWYDPGAAVTAAEFGRFRDAIERLRPVGAPASAGGVGAGVAA